MRPPSDYELTLEDASMPVRTPRFANPPTHLVSDVQPPCGERRALPEIARAARSWSVVAVAALVPMTLGAFAAASMRTPLVSSSLILLAVAVVMHSADRRATRGHRVMAAIRPEDR